MENLSLQRLPAQTADRAVYLLTSICIPDLQLVIDLEGRVEVDRLARALRLLLDAEPVLGCRFVPDSRQPYWERLDESDLDRADLLRVAPVDDPTDEASMAAFVAEPSDGLAGPQVEALLLQGPERDRLVLKLNHFPCDAGGSKQVAYRLAEICRALAGDPDYRPLPNPGSRSLRQIYSKVPWYHAPALATRLTAIGLRNRLPYRSLQLRGRRDWSGTPSFVLHSLDADRLAGLRAYGQHRDATLNDLLVAATFRALVAKLGWDGREGLRLSTTVDLRRHLNGDRVPGICNMSAFTYPHLGKNLGKDFDETLVKVKRYMDRLKRFHLGMDLLPLIYLITRPFPFHMVYSSVTRTFKDWTQSGHMPQVMTNMGPIDLPRLDLGGPRASGAFLIVPIGCPPGVALGVSGDGNRLTLSAGFYDSSFEPEELRAFLKLIDQELPGATPKPFSGDHG